PSDAAVAAETPPCPLVRGSVRGVSVSLRLWVTSHLAELLATIVLDQFRGQRGEVALHHTVEAVQGQADPVIGHAVLREVVGADPLRPVARADQGAPGLGALGAGLLLDLVEEPAA